MKITSIESALFSQGEKRTRLVTPQWAASISSALLDWSIETWAEVSEDLWRKVFTDDHSDSMSKYLESFDELTILRLERDYRRYGELLPSGD